VKRIVTKLPLTELWDDAGPVAASRHRDLTAANIRELLRAGPVRFIVANVGTPLRWVSEGECFQFWKDEVRSRVADSVGAHLEDYPGAFCYFAGEWAATDGPPIVVLSITH
jgi:hypothetical protein